MTDTPWSQARLSVESQPNRTVPADQIVGGQVVTMIGRGTLGIAQSMKRRSTVRYGLALRVPGEFSHGPPVGITTVTSSQSTACPRPPPPLRHHRVGAAATRQPSGSTRRMGEVPAGASDQVGVDQIAERLIGHHGRGATNSAQTIGAELDPSRGQGERTECRTVDTHQTR